MVALIDGPAFPRYPLPLTPKLNPPQDEEDEDGYENYSNAGANHHPDHLKEKQAQVSYALPTKSLGCFLR